MNEFLKLIDNLISIFISSCKPEKKDYLPEKRKRRHYEPNYGINENKQDIGLAVHSAPGVFHQQIGNTAYGSDGSYATRIGNTIYHSDGSTTVPRPSLVYESHATRCHRQASS